MICTIYASHLPCLESLAPRPNPPSSLVNLVTPELAKLLITSISLRPTLKGSLLLYLDCPQHLYNTRLADDVPFQVLVHPWILDIHFDHKRINNVIRDSGIPDVNDTLVKGSGIADEDLEALMVNWNLWSLWSLMIRLHRECQSCTFIN